MIDVAPLDYERYAVLIAPGIADAFTPVLRTDAPRRVETAAPSAPTRDRDFQTHIGAWRANVPTDPNVAVDGAVAGRPQSLLSSIAIIAHTPEDFERNLGGQRRIALRDAAFLYETAGSQRTDYHVLEISA